MNFKTYDSVCIIRENVKKLDDGDTKKVLLRELNTLAKRICDKDYNSEEDSDY